MLEDSFEEVLENDNYFYKCFKCGFTSPYFDNEYDAEIYLVEMVSKNIEEEIKEVKIELRYAERNYEEIEDQIRDYENILYELNKRLENIRSTRKVSPNQINIWEQNLNI